MDKFTRFFKHLFTGSSPVEDVQDKESRKELIESATPLDFQEPEPLWQSIVGCILAVLLFALALFFA